MKRKIILTTALALLLCSCNNELIALKDCPHEMDGLIVELSQSEDYVQTIRISKDGKFLHELVGEFYEGSPVFDKSILFFVDANYDGETDIFIGSGEDRTSNTILLWNSKNNLFERYGNSNSHSFQNAIFSPSEKAIYESGSNSAFDGWYTKSVWEHGILEEAEQIVEISDIKELDEYNKYSDFKVSKKYTLLDKNKNILIEADSFKDLPNNWETVISKLKSIWGVSDEDYSTESETTNNSQDEQSKQVALEENIKKQLCEMINEENGRVLKGPGDIKNLEKVSERNYKARFYIYGEYEDFTYDILNIKVDEDGTVQDFKVKLFRITPTDKKPDGTADPNEIMRRKIQGLQY